MTPGSKKCERCWVKHYCKDNGAVALKEHD